jgi:hypothetical protein
VCNFAFLRLIESRANLPGPEVWLIIRRNLDDPTVVKFYFSNAPLDTPLVEFVRISGIRWPIEIIFEEDKGEIGLDHITRIGQKESSPCSINARWSKKVPSKN